jgi:exodeoxyribonuclease VII small subunit
MTKAEQTENMGDVSFESQLSQLQSSLRRLEQGDLSLDDSLAEYEKGLHMLKSCYGYLEKAERKIELMTKNERGETQSQEFEHESWKARENPSLFE